jgi:hypothetical protein
MFFADKGCIVGYPETAPLPKKAPAPISKSSAIGGSLFNMPESS